MGSQIRYNHDGAEPKGVLYDPTVNQQDGFGRIQYAHQVVVQVEHGVQAQRAHRKANVHAEFVVQAVGCLPDNSVLDLQHLDGGRCRPAGGGGLHDPAATAAGPAAAAVVIALPVRRRPGQQQRISVPDDGVNAESGQVGVDAGKLLVQAVAQDGEVCLDAVHADVLDVHEQESEHCEVDVDGQQPQPEHVDGHGEQQAADDQHARQPGRSHGFCLRGWRECVKPVNVPRVPLQRLVTAQRHGQPGYQARAGHRPDEHALDGRGQRVVASVFQRAHYVLCHVHVVQAGGHQQRGCRQPQPAEPDGATVHREYAKHVPNEFRQSRAEHDGGSSLLSRRIMVFFFVSDSLNSVQTPVGRNHV